MFELLDFDYRYLVQDFVFYGLFFAALAWGAGPERLIATTWLVFFEILPKLYRAVWSEGYQLEQVDLFYAAMDGIAAAVWIFVALYANRNYPLVIAAMQLLVMAAHLARGLIETISPVAYATMMIAPGWFQLLILATGLTRHVLRQRRYGPYREWRLPISFLGRAPSFLGSSKS
ncbi:MAG: hypothetical protein AAGI28_17470 [Pseudomonadota bacterium]